MEAIDLAPPESLDAQWTITIDGFEPLREGGIESIFAVANGYLGSRASLPEGHPKSEPGTFIAGVYDQPETPRPVAELVRAIAESQLQQASEDELNQALEQLAHLSDDQVWTLLGDAP